jgi:hypothetical protein
VTPAARRSSRALELHQGRAAARRYREAIPGALAALKGPVAMNPILRSFFAPADRVVAVHDDSAAALAAIAALGGAGYPARMLAVVSRQCASRAPAARTGDGLRRLAASGLVWGLLTPTLIVAAVAALPAHAVAPMSVLLVAAAAVALQAFLVAFAVAPAREATARWHGPLPAHGAYRAQLEADKLLVVVDGSRSEIALARTILECA